MNAKKQARRERALARRQADVERYEKAFKKNDERGFRVSKTTLRKLSIAKLEVEILQRRV